MEDFHVLSMIMEFWCPGSVLHCEEHGPGAGTAVKEQWSPTRPVWGQVSCARMIVMVMISDLTSVASVGMMSPSPGIVWRGDDLLYLWQLSSAQV